MDIEKFRAFIQEIIDEDKLNENEAIENENDEAEMRYNYAVARLETILEVSKLLDF